MAPQLARRNALFLLLVALVVAIATHPHQQQILASPTTRPLLPRLNITDHLDLKTSYACEGARMDLGCQEGKLIHLVRANYGRFSLSICNEHGLSNYSVICTSFRAFIDVQSRCNKLSNCSITVSRELFGDPCEGTAKYLEVQYYCYDVNSQNATTANNGRRPTTASPVISGASEQTAAPPASHKSQAPPPSQLPPSSQSVGGLDGGGSGQAGQLDQQQQRQRSNARTSGNNSGDNSAAASIQQSAVIQQQQQQPQASLFCPAQTSARGLAWNATRAGQLARQPCPEGATGRASWLCELERARFQPAAGPDFSQCRSIWLARLGHQLDQMLEAPASAGGKPASETQRQQDEQMVKSILGELSLMGRTRKLFSEDLKRVEQMVGQMIGQLRAQAHNVAWQPLAESAFASGGAGVSMHEELFVKVGQLVSSLFELDQRSAWLELPTNEARARLEQRLLGHLKEAGLMLARSLPPDQLDEVAAVRQPNLLASLSALPSEQVIIEESFAGELDLLASSNPRRPPAFQSASSSSSAAGYSTRNQRDVNQPQGAELRLPAQLVKTLWANGVSKFLILDVRKPDYSLIKLALEQQAAGDSATSNLLDGQSLTADQAAQFQARIFGAFPLLADSGQVLDLQRLGQPLDQWPVSVEFRLAAGPADLMAPARHCQALEGASEPGAEQRCQLARFNATNFLCACNRLPTDGFVGLLQQALLVQAGEPPAFPQWAANTEAPAAGEPQQGFYESLGVIKQQQQQQPTQQQQQPQRSPGFLATCFIVIGVSLLVLAAAGLLVGGALRLAAYARLASAKKAPTGFFSSLASAASTPTRGTTTGPLVAAGGGATSGDLNHHNLMLGGDSLISNHAAAPTQSHNFIVGLNRTNQLCGGGTLTGSVSSNYKPHQQLYAGGAPVLEAYSSAPRNPLGRLVGWLLQRGRRQAGANAWLAAARAQHESALAKSEQLVQHRLIGQPTLINGGHAANTLAYAHHQHHQQAHKNPYQNGYTTALGLHQAHQAQQQQQLQQQHHHHHRHQRAHMSSTGSGAPLNSSSNSSYVSSSAYYEEIGTTKPNASNTTLVEPFKQQRAAELGALMGAGQQQHQQQMAAAHHHHFNQQQAWQQQPTTNAISYPIEQQQQQHQAHLHTDLSPLQSSASSSGGATTPRHYLFASPAAAGAYKQQQQQQHFNRGLQD